MVTYFVFSNVSVQIFPCKYEATNYTEDKSILRNPGRQTLCRLQIAVPVVSGLFNDTHLQFKYFTINILSIHGVSRENQQTTWVMSVYFMCV